jgi:hypothetical protein
MSAKIQDAYVVAAVRTPVGKAPRGMFRTTRPDDLLAHVLREACARLPSLDVTAIDDVIVGCAMPEAEQGMNVARIGLLLAGLPQSVAGLTVNRFCASGLQAVAQAADRIRLGEVDVMIGAGAESMSLIPMGGHHIAFNPAVFARDEDRGIAFGMGMTAENVAQRWRVSREDQDAFAVESHRRALAAIEAGEFADEIAPVEIESRTPDLATRHVSVQRRRVAVDEGPRRGHVDGRSRGTEAGIRREGFRHGRQQFADVGRRGRRDPREREGGAALRIAAARAIRGVRGRGRRAGRHGHRPRRGDPEGAAPDRHRAGGARLDRTQRGLRRAVARGDAHARSSIRRG